MSEVCSKLKVGLLGLDVTKEVGDVEGDDNTMDAILVPEIEWLRRRLGRTSAFELIIRLLYFSSKKMKSSGIPKREDKVGNSTRTACKGGFTLAPLVRHHLLLLDHHLPYPSRLWCGCISSESVSRIDPDIQSVLLVPFELKSVTSLVPKIVWKVKLPQKLQKCWSKALNNFFSLMTDFVPTL